MKLDTRYFPCLGFAAILLLSTGGLSAVQAQEMCWTAVGSTGVVDEANLDDTRLGRRTPQPEIVTEPPIGPPSFDSTPFRFEDAVVSLRSNHPTGTASIRYNIAHVHAPAHPNTIKLSVRYSVARNPEARVVALLKRQAINATTPTELADVLAVFDSNDFPALDNFQLRSVEESGRFDFANFAYWVEAILISDLAPSFPPFLPTFESPGAPLVGPAISVIRVCTDSVVVID